jgi:hypothetical protein
MAGIALFALWLLAFTLVRGGRVLPPVTLHLLTSLIAAAGPLDPATLRTVRWAPGPLLWAVRSPRPPPATCSPAPSRWAAATPCGG